MEGYLKTSEIGLHSVVHYRAKVLGITPIGFVLSDGRHENTYSLEDAERILTFKSPIRFHSIKHFETLLIIVHNEKLRNNIPLAAKDFRISEPKLRTMIDEYNKSGCFIVASKMNQENLIRWIIKKR